MAVTFVAFEPALVTVTSAAYAALHQNVSLTALPDGFVARKLPLRLGYHVRYQFATSAVLAGISSW